MQNSSSDSILSRNRRVLSRKRDSHFTATYWSSEKPENILNCLNTTFWFCLFNNEFFKLSVVNDRLRSVIRKTIGRLLSRFYEVSGRKIGGREKLNNFITAITRAYTTTQNCFKVKCSMISYLIEVRFHSRQIAGKWGCLKVTQKHPGKWRETEHDILSYPVITTCSHSDRS